MTCNNVADSAPQDPECGPCPPRAGRDRRVSRCCARLPPIGCPRRTEGTNDVETCDRRCEWARAGLCRKANTASSWP
jgi:hypothetical protein